MMLKMLPTTEIHVVAEDLMILSFLGPVSIGCSLVACALVNLWPDQMMGDVTAQLHKNTTIQPPIDYSLFLRHYAFIKFWPFLMYNLHVQNFSEFTWFHLLFCFLFTMPLLIWGNINKSIPLASFENSLDTLLAYG